MEGRSSRSDPQGTDLSGISCPAGQSLQAVGLVPVQHQPQDLGAQLGEGVGALCGAWRAQVTGHWSVIPGAGAERG